MELLITWFVTDSNMYLVKKNAKTMHNVGNKQEDTFEVGETTNTLGFVYSHIHSLTGQL